MSAKAFHLIAFALSTLQVAGWSSYVCAESRNEIHGQVCAGARTSGAADNRPIAGVMVEAFGADNKVIATAVTATDARGWFSIVVPVEIKAYRLFVYDPNADYWIFSPKGEKINDRHPMDLGRILLYPRNTRLTADEAREQFEAAQFIQSVDKPAGDLAMLRLASEYPKVYGVEWSADRQRLVSGSTDHCRAAIMMSPCVESVGRPAQKLSLTAALVLTPEFCATVDKENSQQLRVGKAACAELERVLKGNFTSLTRVDDSSKAGDAQVVLEPKFVDVAATKAAIAFSNRELDVQVEWTVRDQSGRAVWTETVQGSSKHHKGNAFVGGKNMKRIVNDSVKDVAEQSAIKMSASPELRKLSAEQDKQDK